VTPSGETMLRLKDVCCVGPASRRSWRNSRAERLAIMIAWHRKTRGDYARRIIIEDIVPDIGWPPLSWLKHAVRAAQADIRRRSVAIVGLS
jgi:hypothetical protein